MFDQKMIRKLNNKARKVKKAVEHGANRAEVIRLQNSLSRARKEAVRIAEEAN